MLKSLGLTLTATAALTMCASGHAAAQAVTFAKDIAPIVYARCVPCHQPQGDGPFSLLTYEDVRRRSGQIVEATRRRVMPPWKPDADSGPFLGDRRLTDTEVELFARWATLGSPRGRASDMPPPPRLSSGWLLGEPDVVMRLPPYQLGPGGPDVFRNFVVTVPGNGPRYIRGFQFRPGNRGVHHANVFVDRTQASRQLDTADPGPGYEGLILRSAQFPDGHFLGWTPGQAPPLGSSELAWRVEGGADLVVQLHLQPTGRPETIAPVIGLYFTPVAPATTPTIIRLGRQNLEIPAGAANYRVTDSFVLPVDALVAAIQAHAHFRAREVTAVATLPDGTHRSLLGIRDWDFAWQDQYRFASPFWLPAGTSLHIDYTFDNSDANPRNPDHPPQRVEWGWRSSDEMGDVWIQVMTRSERDRERLFVASRRKMAAEDAIGSEVLIARNPDHLSLRNDAALIYMELGRPLDAYRHFAAVTRLSRQSPVAWYNEGVSLEAAGKSDDAVARYAEAIRLDPAYSSAHNNLGNVLAASGHIADALTEYREALRTNPDNAEAHCSLARGLTVTGNPHGAVAEYLAALRLRPDWTACTVSYVWLISAHADPAVRRPAEAVALAERVAAGSAGTEAAVLDALAVAYAAAGRFDAAVRAATAAILAAEQGGMATTSLTPAAPVEGMRERLALFRQGKPFVVPD